MINLINIISYNGYQVPYASVIKQYVRLPIIAVGEFYTANLSNAILADKLADIMEIGRLLLDDPLFGEK
jgi:NADPH2 dehydrogenase